MPTLDDELRRRFEEAGGPPAPGSDVRTSIARRARRREVRRRIQAVVLTACVLVGTVGGFVVLQRAFRGTDPTLPTSLSPSPSLSPDAEGRDIGLGTRLCQVERLAGLDLIRDGVPDVAWTGVAVRDDGTCPAAGSDRAAWVVAVDLTGDGIADASSGIPLVNCPYVGCSPLGASDLDGDGDGELIVRTWFTVQDQGYFAVTPLGDGADDYALSPILVAEPGDPAAGIDPGGPLQTSTGGDAGLSAWVRCEGYPEAPVLVYSWVFADIEEEEESEWHEVALRLQDDGRFHVVDSTDISLPPGEDPGFVRSDAPACGVDFTP